MYLFFKEVCHLDLRNYPDCFIMYLLSKDSVLRKKSFAFNTSFRFEIKSIFNYLTILGWYSFLFSQNCRFELLYCFHLCVNLTKNFGARV